jgi:hypothetical protein
MKHILLVIAIFTSFALKAQYSLTTSNNPVTGDVFETQETFSTGISLPASGTNQVWNYTGIVMNTTATPYSVTYTPVSSIPNASLFPNATIGTTDGQGSYEMYSVSSSSVVYLGTSAATASDCSVYSDPIIFMKLPFSYGNAYSDNFSISNSQYAVSGNILMNADGTGTLVLPGFTFTNVLKTAMTLTQNITIGTSNIIIKNNTHNFYSSSNKFPLFSVTSQTTSVPTSTTIEVYAQVNKMFLVAGLKDNTNDFYFDLYPNPATAKEINVNFFNTGNTSSVIRIVNVMGQEIKNLALSHLTAGENKLKMDLKAVPAGVYFLKLKTGDS